MKIFRLLIILFLLGNLVIAQDSSNLKVAEELAENVDFSKVFICDKFKTDERDQVINRMEPLGYFDDNFQRIFIHFISVVKNNDEPNQYFVHGKSRLKNNICDFQGIMNLTEIKEYINHELPKYRRGYITGTYSFHEDQKQKGTGKLEGKFTSYWLINDEGQVEYDAAMFVADGYSNNEFEGKWISHSSGTIKKCNWGDYRIPDSNELDGGAGEFYPLEDYWHLGWKTYVEQGNQDSDPIAIKAREIERTEWWK